MLVSAESAQEKPGYNYGRFRAGEYALDAFVGPAAGEMAPDFDATTLDGRQVRLSGFRGQLVVLETGSITCPQYVARIEAMQRLARQHPDVHFLLLYVREAHPGSHIGEHSGWHQKLDLARRLVEEENENRLVLVDNLDGAAHRAYGSLPDMVYVIDAEGRIRFASHWNCSSAVARVLENLRAGMPLTGIRGGFRPVSPWCWCACCIAPVGTHSSTSCALCQTCSSSTWPLPSTPDAGSSITYPLANEPIVVSAGPHS